MEVYNRLFEIINPNDRSADRYFSGPRFISKVREVEPYFPNYGQYLSERRRNGESTSRRDYFYDILLDLEEAERVRVLNSILNEVEDSAPEKVEELRGVLSGAASAPSAAVSEEAWNADRLNKYLEDIDNSISSTEYERAVTLCYTCLEGFYKSFVRQNVPDQTDEKEIIKLSKIIRRYLRGSLDEYPDEALTMINHVSHTVDKTRNQFSESHFANETARWMATYMRDLVNSQIRMLLHFMSGEE